MHHFLQRSRSLIAAIGFLLLTITAGASPPADSPLPSPYFSASEATANARALGTIRILAVMVEFQEEDNRFTTGNGTFDLPFLHRDDIIIDPLPHDRGYFEAHLEFAKNYFQTVSGGKLNIEYHILPEIIRLDEPMSAYAPLGETGEENFKLANLARDAWQKAGQTAPPDLDGYEDGRTMFIVFHAGSGRNIELMGTSLTKTPQDIPSVYLGTRSLQRLLNDPGFQGFDIGDPDIRVTNTALLPQTQSRPGEDITGQEYVLELSINGILVANIGSFLGLPDLFNTETGASAIGRFGLMDGASIFSYLGLFPPEPSAWEKMHLGWLEPFDVNLDSSEPVRLPAVSLRQPNSLARHAISRDEYFLVENRHRNPSGQPLEVTIRRPDGQYVTRTIAPDDYRFDPFNSAAYDEILDPGVVVNVSSFDWSLPGGPDAGRDGVRGTDDDRILDGGMLIWHIDEAVIRNAINDNRVNANSNRRGVQLVEADGARDIGRQPGFGQNRFTNGHAFDFWWSGNDFTVITAQGDSIVVYENRFGPDTRPSNHSNTGSPSYFEFFDFSDNIPEAYFHARSLAGAYTQTVTPPFPTLPVPSSFPAESGLFPASPAIATDNQNGSAHLLIPVPDGFFSTPVSAPETAPVSAPETAPVSAPEIAPVSAPETAPGNSPDNGSGMDQPQRNYVFLPHPEPTSPLVLDNRLTSGQFRTRDAADAPNDAGQQTVRTWSLQNGVWSLLWELEDIPAGPGLISLGQGSQGEGDMLLADMTRIRMDTDGTLLPEQDEARQQSGQVDGITASIHNDRFALSDGSFSFNLDREDMDSRRKYTGNLRFSGDSGPSFFILTDHRLQIVDRSGRDEWQVTSLIRSESLSWPAFGDFTGDQALDIFVTDFEANQVYGFNRDGGMLDFFPMRAPRHGRFAGSPLLADITGDGQQEILVAVSDTLTVTIHAFDRQHQPVEGFPLLVGSLIISPNHNAGSSHASTNRLEAVSNAGQPVMLPLLIADGQLLAVSPAGEVRAWFLTELGEIAWGSVYGNQPGNKVGRNMERERLQRPEFGLLNKQETYNWPNPAEDHTWIRFETSGPARIDITVINPSGATIFETQSESQGRFPEEIRMDTSSWGNGIYFARVRARNGAESETKLIKIVVTH
ncbi:MAG: T9SS C-terminal target domain-containing protein [Balneolaceae bacterium]|nr:MAG: T9SS C-terminal target domain-containing protein [Balneolaceae bacterium]